MRTGTRRVLAPRRESEAQAAILAYLQSQPGLVAWKAGAGAFRVRGRGGERFVRMGRPGVSDIVGFASRLVAGRRVAVFLAVEVKGDRGRATPEQRLFLAQVGAAGGLAVVARGVTDVASALRELPGEGVP